MLSALLVPDAAFDCAMRIRLVAVLVQKDKRAHEARRSLFIRGFAQLAQQLRIVRGVVAMLAEAKENAGPLADEICFMEMNAEALTFAPERFDAVISRNLTWNLPHPDRAYAEWTRVLKKGGVLLNFDANWYAYLFDEDAQAAWDRDRRSSAERGVRDQNVEAEGEHFDVMEEIARRVPLSKIARPAWDLQQLASLGLKAEADETVWKRVWSEEEMISFASTPMFLVRGRK